MNENILDEELTKGKKKLIEASKGKRFANYLIDLVSFIFFYMFLSFFIPFLLEENNGLIDRIISMIIYGVYYTVIETLLNGKTIGKYFTKTRTVNLDGTRPDFAIILKKSFSRIVPFNSFSFLGEKSTGWHDKWSDTTVIDEKLSNL